MGLLEKFGKALDAGEAALAEGARRRRTAAPRTTAFMDAASVAARQVLTRRR